MPNLTTNFSFNQPLVNDPVDEDLWGGLLNDNWNDTDGLLPLSGDTKTASFTVDSGNTGFRKVYYVDTNLGNVTGTLPPFSAVFDGYQISFKVIDTTNTFTLDGDGTEEIDGATTLVVGDAVVLSADITNSQWRSVGGVETVPAASTTVAGISRYSTDVEAEAQSVTTAALTPSNLAAIEATAAEMEAETANRFVPANLVNRNPFVPKALVRFVGSTGTISESENITSVVRNSAGNYTITFTTAFSTSTYLILLGAFNAGSAAEVNIDSQTTTTVRLGFTNGGAGADPSTIHLLFMGDQ